MRSLYVFSALCATALGHIEMSSPYPFRSKFDPANSSGTIDYSMTNPLAMDGSNFPCKGYHRGGNGRTTASYNVGGSYSISLAGSATHGGGSCQISLSFDNGGSFQVIKSIMGGCPLTKQYSFTIPSGVPSGKALLAWSWFNKIGNREMYMNCAPVSIGGGASEDSGEEELEKRAALPALFVANVGNGCTTIEGTEPVFANPGSSVEYGGSVTPNSPVTPRC